MIPVLVGEEQAEAHRIQHGLAAAGIAVELVGDLSQRRSNSAGIALVHFSKVAKLSRQHNLRSLIAFGGADRAEVAVRTMQQGATQYLPEGADIQLVSSAIRDSSSNVKSTTTKHTVFRSAAMQRILGLAERVAQADISVLISGESGTGKEVIARHIHASSDRADRPFIAVNCAAIPETMLEAVLFGHDKGAFTGASEKRLGKFELADGGTLLLDEITEMPIALQAKLLRVLQEKEVERVGSNRPRQIDVRVLATSNRDLPAAITNGHLREDLYYRLSVFPMVLPTLRERSDDVLPLAEHFLHKHASRGVPLLSETAQQSLLKHSWPGNVRELENCIQRALVMCVGEQVEPVDLGIDQSIQSTLSSVDAEEETSSLRQQMRSSEEQLLLRTLDENRGVRKSSAAQLGISERTLRYKLKQLKDRGILT